jgi:membrane associated rhomboid family serine protease
MSYRPYRRPGISPIWVLIGVNLVIFIASLLDHQGLIISRFALIPANLRDQPWTILTYMFLHGSIWHILFNMVALYFLGTFSIYLIGETAFLITYFVGGIMGGLLYVVLAPLLGTSFSIVVGASGAIFALGGLLMVMRPNLKVVMFPIPIEMPLWVSILINFVLVVFNVAVAWEAHLGGLILGAAVGYYYRRRESRRY